MSQKFPLGMKWAEDVIFKDKKIALADLPMDEVEASYRFLEEFAAEKVIYGINTGFGPMAQWRVDDKYLKDLQYNIIRSHSTGAGNFPSGPFGCTSGFDQVVGGDDRQEHIPVHSSAWKCRGERGLGSACPHGALHDWGGKGSLQRRMASVR